MLQLPYLLGQLFICKMMSKLDTCCSHAWQVCLQVRSSQGFLYVSSSTSGLVLRISLLCICRFLRYEPDELKVALEIFLTYIAPVHYNAIRSASRHLPF